MQCYNTDIAGIFDISYFFGDIFKCKCICICIDEIKAGKWIVRKYIDSMKCNRIDKRKCLVLLNTGHTKLNSKFRNTKLRRFSNTKQVFSWNKRGV